MNKKSIMAILLGMTMAASMVGCTSSGPNQPTASGNGSEVVENGPNITDMSEEKVVETHKLKEVSYGEGETPANPFYKKGNDPDGNVCYIVSYQDGDGEVYLPLDGTVIYTMSDEESYMEKVSYSYKIDGEQVEEEQNRLYINTGSSNAAGDSSAESSQTETPESADQANP